MHNLWCWRTLTKPYSPRDHDLRYSEDQWVKSVDQARVFVWLLQQCRLNSQDLCSHLLLSRLQKVFDSSHFSMDFSAQVTPDMIARMEKGFLNGLWTHSCGSITIACDVVLSCAGPILLRDYTQDLEAHVAAKSEKLVPEQLAMYQDHVAKHHASAAVLGESIDLEDAQDWASGWFIS